MKKVTFVIAYFEEIITSVLLVLMVLSVFVGVVFRYGLNNPLIWTEEVARISSTWFIFLGGAICFKRRAHIQIDVLLQVLPAQVARALSLLGSVLMIVVLLVIIVQGYQYTSRSFVLVTTALGLPVAYWNAAVPIGSALMLIRLLQTLIADVRRQPSQGGL